VAHATVAGIPAAQALFPWLPRVLLARDTPVAVQIAALIHGAGDTGGRSDRAEESAEDKFVRRLRAATAARDLRAINRLLEEGPASCSQVAAEVARGVIRNKFPRKKDGELADRDGEATWAQRWQAACGGGGGPVAISARELVRWARAKRDKAADVGGYSGRLILELHEFDPAVTDALAAVYSMPPERWVHRGGATATWRVLAGAFVPQPGKPSPRPVATATVPRRAWGSAVVRRLRDDAARYCEDHFQFGMSKAGGQTAYVLAAQVLHALGADIVVDDRANSFHELYRSSILDATGAFIEALPVERRGEAGKPLVELLTRTFLSSNPDRPVANDPLLPRSRYTFAVPGVATKVHTGLCQGSSESSLLEAITYATSSARSQRPPGVLRCELHDDGFTAALGEADISVFARSDPGDGSLIATGKDKALGPRAGAIVAAGHSKQATAHVLIAGVPVGDVAEGLQIWERRFATRLQRLRRVAQIDPTLAAHAACAVGGPAGMANHILRALPPSDATREVWRRADALWVQMWADIIGGCDAEELDALQDRLFLQKTSLGMRHSSAEQFERLRYAEGVASAAWHLERIVSRVAPFDSRAWDALGATRWRDALGHESQDKWDGAALQEAAHAEAARCRALVAEADEARIQRLRRGRIYPDVRDPEGDDSAAPPNLFTAWLRLPPPDSVREGTPMTREDGVTVLRRMFRLPLSVGATDFPSPRSCRWCKAPAALPGADGKYVAPREAPRKAVDAHGEHALTCARSRGELQRRHNALAYAVVECIRPTGQDPACAGERKMFESHGGRPADIWVQRHPTYPAGQAIDCTIVSAVGPGRDAAAAAETRKWRKYEDEVRGTQGLGFAPFAVDLTGELGPSAWELMRDWARGQLRGGHAERLEREATEWTTAVIAHAFVKGCARQLRAFANSQTREERERGRREEEQAREGREMPPSDGGRTETSTESEEGRRAKRRPRARKVRGRPGVSREQRPMQENRKKATGASEGQRRRIARSVRTRRGNTVG
jgi:hypothetical protein